MVASGAFTEGRAPPSSLDELIRVARPGGHLAFNVRDDFWEEWGFRERQDGLEAALAGGAHVEHREPPPGQHGFVAADVPRS